MRSFPDSSKAIKGGLILLDAASGVVKHTIAAQLAALESLVNPRQAHPCPAGGGP